MVVMEGEMVGWGVGLRSPCRHGSGGALLIVVAEEEVTVIVVVVEAVGMVVVATDTRIALLAAEVSVEVVVDSYSLVTVTVGGG
jgi:hypothetical protein